MSFCENKDCDVWVMRSECIKGTSTGTALELEWYKKGKPEMKR